MDPRALLGSTRARVIVIAALGLAVWLLWRFLAPPPVQTPSRIASLPRHDKGYYFDLAAQVRDGARDDPRLGLTAAAAYGNPADALPTLGVFAGVIKIGHGDEIASSVLAALPGGGVSLGARSAAPAGKHGGTFECGAATYGAESGTYCAWWNAGVVGVAVVVGLDERTARQLALTARDATQR